MVALLHIFERDQDRYKGYKWHITSVIGQIRVRNNATKKNHKLSNAIKMLSKRMNTAIRKAKKIYPNLQKE